MGLVEDPFHMSRLSSRCRVGASGLSLGSTSHLIRVIIATTVISSMILFVFRFPFWCGASLVLSSLSGVIHFPDGAFLNP